MSRSLLYVTLFALLLSVPRGAVGQASTGFTVEDYAALVHRYLQGERRTAGRELAKVTMNQVEGAATEYMSRWLVDVQKLAAVLLHTDMVISMGAEPAPHFRLAQKWMAQIEESRRRDFQRKWFLALTYLYQSTLRGSDAFAMISAGLQIFPEDIELQLALGSMSETIGWMEGDEGILKHAAKQFRNVLDIEPDNSEAHVRLGRVLKILGRDEEAVRELRWGIEGCDDSRLQIAAYLSLGDIYKGRNQLSEAIRLYRAAVEVDPQCQSAAIALGFALHKIGDAAGSTEVINGFLTRSSTPRVDRNYLGASPHDVWWRYLLGNSDHFDLLVQELRSEIEP